MKSLYAILADEPIETLRSLATWWGTDAPNSATTEDRQRLERSMRDRIAARFVWERLSAPERRALFAIVGPSARNWALIEDLPERAQLSERKDAGGAHAAGRGAAGIYRDRTHPGVRAGWAAGDLLWLHRPAQPAGADRGKRDRLRSH